MQRGTVQISWRWSRWSTKRSVELAQQESEQRVLAQLVKLKVALKVQSKDFKFVGGQAGPRWSGCASIYLYRIFIVIASDLYRLYDAQTYI